MPIARDSLLTLDVERPAVGGRMIARHEGQIVLVADAIPGERVTARVERVSNSVAFAQAVEVLSASPDRRTPPMDPRCGGSVLAHISYPRQLQLKSEIIRDAFARIARVRLSHLPDVMASPEHGYRMRARLHARRDRLGFFREGTARSVRRWRKRATPRDHSRLDWDCRRGVAAKRPDRPGGGGHCGEPCGG